jgi:hypothetical protein
MNFTLEQQFLLKSFEINIKEMSKEQLEIELYKLCELMIIKENMYKTMLLEGAGFVTALQEGI